MKNNKVIHTRVTDALHEAISDKAELIGITISDYSRRQLTQSVEFENPLHATDLLFVFAYIEYNCDECKTVCTYEVKHILSIIKRHYPNLEPELQVVFDEVITKMNQYLKRFDLFSAISDVYLCFGDDSEAINFDYNTFYKCTNGKLPYR